VAGVWKRKSDKARGKSGKYIVWWIGEDGRRHTKPGLTDRARSLELANHLEAEARRVREGVVEPGERTRREASLKPVAAHVEDYRLGLSPRGTPRRTPGRSPARSSGCSRTRRSRPWPRWPRTGSRRPSAA
jgi:hypothetical protein